MEFSSEVQTYPDLEQNRRYLVTRKTLLDVGYVEDPPNSGLFRGNGYKLRFSPADDKVYIVSHMAQEKRPRSIEGTNLRLIRGDMRNIFELYLEEFDISQPTNLEFKDDVVHVLDAKTEYFDRFVSVDGLILSKDGMHSAARVSSGKQKYTIVYDGTPWLTSFEKCDPPVMSNDGLKVGTGGMIYCDPNTGKVIDASDQSANFFQQIVNGRSVGRIFHASFEGNQFSPDGAHFMGICDGRIVVDGISIWPSTYGINSAVFKSDGRQVVAVQVLRSRIQGDQMASQLVVNGKVVEGTRKPNLLFSDLTLSLGNKLAYVRKTPPCWGRFHTEDVVNCGVSWGLLMVKRCRDLAYSHDGGKLAACVCDDAGWTVAVDGNPFQTRFGNCREIAWSNQGDVATIVEKSSDSKTSFCLLGGVAINGVPHDAFFDREARKLEPEEEWYDLRNLHFSPDGRFVRFTARDFNMHYYVVTKRVK